jgi:hypothetical protein
VVTVTDLFGFTNSYNGRIRGLVVNALGGDDNTTIESAALFPGVLVRPSTRASASAARTAPAATA